MKYKLLLILPLCILLLSGCKSAARYLELGDYDKAIDKTIKVLKKKPTKESAFIILEKAYKEANNTDIHHINELKKSGDPSLWEEIYYTYLNLENRDQKILHLESSIAKRLIPFPVDYTADIENAKLNATKFLYEVALRLLSTNIKADAQVAYECLLRVKDFYPNYKDVDEQLAKARIQGTVQILIRINNSGQWRSLPFEVRNILSDFNTNALDKEWVLFSTKDDFATMYDYYLDLSFNWSVVLPPEYQNKNYFVEKEITEIRKINDSTEAEETYVVRCQVEEFAQRRISKMHANLELQNISKGIIVYEIPLAAEFLFLNQWAIANGDYRALNNEILSLLGQREKPNPSDLNMLMGVSEILLDKIQKEIEYCAVHEIE